MTGFPRRFTRRVVMYLCFFVVWALFTVAGSYGYLRGHQSDKIEEVETKPQPEIPERKLKEDIHPKNVSGYYKGTWESRGIDERLEHALMWHKLKGDLMMDVRVDSETSDGAHVVHGDVLLRNGLHLTDTDLRFSMEGMYFPELHRMTALLKPRRTIAVRINEEEISRNDPFYRAALRKEALRWTENPPPLLKFGVPPEKQMTLKHHCQFHLNLKFVPQNFTADSNPALETEPPFLSDGMNVTGVFHSPNCNVTLAVKATSFQLEKIYTKAVHYTLVVAILTFLQILLLIKQIEGTSTPATSMRVSMLCISQQTVMDAYLCLLHLTAGLVVEPLFNAFAMVSFFEFVLFAIFEMRYMLLIWRAQLGQSNHQWDTRRQLWTLYTRFYGVLLAGILAAFQLKRYMQYVTFLLYSFWIPQIIHCIRSDLRQPLKPFFIIGTSITRLMLPLYVYGCPVNILGIRPSPSLCVGLVAYVSLQMTVLLVQYYYGPHCFLPKRFLPHKHDYFRSLNQDEIEDVLKRNGDMEAGEAGVTECVICMNPVEINRPMARMVTPCNHFFHPQCLQRWMDVKMECPTCRTLLPPL